MNMYLAVDIGGSKTLIGVFDSAGNLKETSRFNTPSSYDDFIGTLATKLPELNRSKFKAAGVAAPGKIDRKTGLGIAFGNLAWENVPLAQDIGRLAGCPVKVENDANLAGLSEAQLLPEYKRVLYVTVSTGIGGVIISNGKIDPATQDAEIGHILLEHDGRLMRWQEFASGKAIYRKYGKKVSQIDEKDTTIWYEIARNIAIGLIDVIAMLTPDVIVIGGGVGNHLSKFYGRLLEELKIYENPLITVPPIHQAKHPGEAVIYGCYELIRTNYA